MKCLGTASLENRMPLRFFVQEIHNYGSSVVSSLAKFGKWCYELWCADPQNSIVDVCNMLQLAFKEVKKDIINVMNYTCHKRNTYESCRLG